MNRALTLLLLCGVAAGCGSRSPNVASAPTYGSSPKLSTPEGFLEGTWIHSFDDSNARRKMGFIEKSALSMVEQSLRFSKNHTFEYSVDEVIAHGTWTIDPQGIHLSATDVNGITIAKLESEHLKPSHRRSMFRRNTDLEYQAYTLIKVIGRLGLDADKKRLTDLDTRTAEDGTTFMGRPVWTRKL